MHKIRDKVCVHFSPIEFQVAWNWLVGVSETQKKIKNWKEMLTSMDQKKNMMEHGTDDDNPSMAKSNEIRIQIK